MTDMQQIIDYKTAPLSQWEIPVGEDLSEGKKKEDAAIYPHIARALQEIKAEHVLGLIADEARLEHYLVQEVPTMKCATHLTLKGAFEAAARHTCERGHDKRVRLSLEKEETQAHSQDAVVMNMILGCVATPKDHQNMTRMMDLSAHYLRAAGKLLLVRPNPKGGRFDTYVCTTPKKDLRAGDSYQFIVKGLEDLGEMDNLYSPDNLLKRFLEASQFEMGVTQELPYPGQKEHQPAPFLMNVCTYNG